MNMRLLVTFIFLGMFMFAIDSYALNNNGPHDSALKKITISDPGQKLVLQLDYSDGCKITQLKVKGKNVLSESGVYTGFRTRGGSFTSCSGQDEIKVEESGNKILIKNIIYGDHSISVNESWSFDLNGDKIIWNINRKYSNLA